MTSSNIGHRRQRRTAAGIGALVALAVLAGVVLATRAPALAATIGPGQTAPIVGVQSGRCLDVSGAGTANGAATQLWDCTGGTNQRWTYTAGRQLTVYGSKCLDAYGHGTTNGTAVVIWDCNGQTNQQWSVNADGTVTGVQSGLCLTPRSAGTAGGTRVVLWTCGGGAEQQWRSPGTGGPSSSPSVSPPGSPSGSPSVSPSASAPAPACSSSAGPLPAPSMSATLLRGGFAFTEGPTWVANPGYLLFSDLQSATGSEGVQPSNIWRYTPQSTFEQFIPNAGSNGLAVTADGTRIIAATHDQRSVSAYSLADHARTSVAGQYNGKLFNSPNDLTIAADGTVYFTDPNYQRGNRPDAMSGMTGVFRVRNGQVELVDGGLRQPNGIALSPDGRTLYVAAMGTNQIVKYPIGADGTIGARSVFTSINGPDGVTIDCAGNLYWASNPEGTIHVYAPSGAQLGLITVGRATTNAAFGGADGRTLFITSGTPSSGAGLYSVRLNLPGNPY
ncbi:SMP-30/gluconolactonase/LRE family protein [Dactylosporangium vinaceum]|uniref:SMP-30/gluconolactonase/LRE family protein n=1 Tax=Dactylosporangium vinaceum TaxID=53362 RepID=A0ABV5MNN1_9ACTN|nr:SMP-30/gluconolactonase/LRE family protein [Dactylosporangium vinaceum]